MSTCLFIHGSARLDPLRALAIRQGLVSPTLDPSCLLVTDGPLTDTVQQIRVSFHERPCDPIVISGLGFKAHPDLQTQFTLSLRWDGEWDEQLLLALPVRGTANGNLGPQDVVGWGSRYVDNSKLRVVFESDQVTQLVKQVGQTGFVSFGFAVGAGKCHVTSMWLGLPPFVIWNALEGVKGDLGRFYSSPMPRLYESWVIGTLVHSDDGPAIYQAVWCSALSRAGALLTAKCLSTAGCNKWFRTDVETEVRKSWRLVETIVK